MRLLTANEALTRLANNAVDSSGISAELLSDSHCGPALRIYNAFTVGFFDDELSPEDVFCNRYYWFHRFAFLHRQKFGFDAGIEDQASQILEKSNWGDLQVDVATIVELESMARSEH